MRVAAGFQGLTGFVRQAASWPADHRTAEAAREAGLHTVALQLDGENHEANMHEVSLGWQARWQFQGIDVVYWWRVNHNKARVPGGMVANPEDDDEVALIPDLIQHGAAAIITLGKRPGVPVDLLNKNEIVLFAETFREGPASDTTIQNCYDWWNAAGLDMRLFRPCIQLYGTPFAPVFDQAQTAARLRVSGAGIYPAEIGSVQDWEAIDKGWDF